jgi:hypothetical protein
MRLVICQDFRHPRINENVKFPTKNFQQTTHLNKINYLAASLAGVEGLRQKFDKLLNILTKWLKVRQQNPSKAPLRTRVISKFPQSLSHLFWVPRQPTTDVQENIGRPEFLAGTAATALAGPSAVPPARERRIGDLILRDTEFNERGEAIGGVVYAVKDGVKGHEALWRMN